MQQCDPETYARQLADKVADFHRRCADLALPDTEVFHSAPRHFRLRAEFRIWREDGVAQYAMHRSDDKSLYRVEAFPIAAERINQLMPPLLGAINRDAALGCRLFAVEFLTTLGGEALVTLIYHRPLDDDWQRRAARLATALGIDIVGRSRRQKRVIGRDHVQETLAVAGLAYRYRQIEGAFTQPNGRVNQQMLGWALARTTAIGGDLLELYCGNGNFTLVLAQNFDRVLATEVAAAAVAAARHNLADNGIANVDIVRMTSAEVAAALAGVRPFRRLRDIDLARYRFSTLLVDPPRAGLDAATLALARGFEHILYISCNPATLHANLVALGDSHRVTHCALFDQFPYTPHLECGVLLCRRDRPAPGELRIHS